MPLSLAEGVCATSVPTVLMRASCPDWSDKGLSGLRFPYGEKVIVRGKESLCVYTPHSPRRFSTLRKRRPRAFAKLESVSSAKNRQVKALSLRDPHTLVLERVPDDTLKSTDPASAIDWTKIEVVGKEIDLDEEVSLMRKKKISEGKKRKKPQEMKMKLEALQSQAAQDSETSSTLATEEVKLRLEGDASNLAESVDSLHEKLSTVLRESHLNGWTLKGSNFENMLEGESSAQWIDAGANGSVHSITLDGDISEEKSNPSASQKGYYRSYIPEVAIPQSCRGRQKGRDIVLSTSVRSAPSNFIELGSSMEVEMSSTLDTADKMTTETVGVGREVITSKTKLDSRNGALSVVLKKPASLNTLNEEDVSDSEEDVETHWTDDDSSHPDLISGLEALRKLISSKNLELAKDLAKQLYEWYPRNTDVLLECAFVEKQCGDLVAAGSLYSQAISAFESQKDLGYDYIRALQALGSIEARARNAKRARVFFMESIHAARQAEQRSPEITGAGVYGLHAWARLEEQLGNYSKAQELLIRAAEMQPGNAVVHQSRALLEAKAHNWAAARHHFKLAVKAAPMDVKCWHAWAIFEAAQGRHERMRKLFQEALEVDPTNVHSLQAWAHQETLIGTHESKETARALFQKCTQVDPRNLYSWQAWACMEKASGHFDKACELFEKCLEINPWSVVCLQAFANMERNLGNLIAAQRLLHKALKVEPENAAVLMETALVERALGNHELADKLFVLAGMADKRKSQVRNKMFHSRKEVMPWKAGKWKREMIAKAKKAKQVDDMKGEMKSDTNVKKASNTTVSNANQKEVKAEMVVNRKGPHVKQAEGAAARSSRRWATQLSGA